MMRDDLELLDFPKVMDQIKKYAYSSMGRELLDSFRPVLFPWDELKRLEEMIDYINKEGAPPIEGIEEVENIFKKLESGSLVDPPELLRIAYFLGSSQRLKDIFFSEKDEYPKIWERFSNLPSFDHFIGEVKRCISEDGEIVDDASPKLRDLRIRKRSLQKTLKKKAEEYINKNRMLLQEDIYVLRDGRYLFPVKSSMKGKVRGIVHHVSSSGATVFIEPEEFVFLNNDMRFIEEEERGEISRILRKLSRLLTDRLKDLKLVLDAMAYYDTLQARARFAKENEAVVIHPKTGGKIKLVNARHPLIPKETVVPITVEVGGRSKGLVITGPNMGGKTVTLKTIGLFTAMAMAGFPVLCDPSSEIRIFSKILVDIGEEQDIEQSLSTFSSHMKRIAAIMEEADEDSLVLLDELGSGTDPVEGSALAMALIEELIERGATFVVTTHLTPVKIFAMNNQYVLNASMEFDPETLSPTFHVLMGVPGGSHAFYIAEKLGLKKNILERAKTKLSQEEMKMEDLIRSLHERLALLEEETKRMEEEKSKYLEMRRKYEEEYTRLKKGKIEEFDKELKDIRDYIKKVKKEIDEAIHLMKKKKLEEMREISKKLEKEKEKLKKIETPTVETEELKVGDNVRIKDGTSIGKVIEVFEKDLLVDFGTMRMRLPRNMVIKVEKKEETFEKLDVIRIERLEKPEVDIRGKTIEESEPLIKNFIDKLVMSDFKKGYIIHGKGTGRLAAGVWEILRKDPRVISYRFGMPSEGGTGVTVVEVRS